MSQGLTLSILRLPLVWGLRTHHGHQVVNFFHLVVVLASVKQLGILLLGTSQRSQSRGLGGRGLSREGPVGPAWLPQHHSACVQGSLILLINGPKVQE